MPRGAFISRLASGKVRQCDAGDRMTTMKATMFAACIHILVFPSQSIYNLRAFMDRGRYIQCGQCGQGVSGVV